MFEAFDYPIQSALAANVGRSVFFDHAVNAITRFHSFKGMVMLAMFWFLWFQTSKTDSAEAKDNKRISLLIVLAGSFAAVVFSRLLQLTFNIHLRPAVSNLGLNYPDFVSRGDYNKWNSFPSDHAMLFFALAMGLYGINRRVGVVAFLWTMIVICLPRLYMGFHYPSDVIGGLVLGILFMKGFERLPVKPLASKLYGWGKLHPAIFYSLGFYLTDQIAHLFDDFRELAASIGHHSSIVVH